MRTLAKEASELCNRSHPKRESGKNRGLRHAWLISTVTAPGLTAMKAQRVLRDSKRFLGTGGGLALRVDGERRGFPECPVGLGLTAAFGFHPNWPYRRTFNQATATRTPPPGCPCLRRKVISRPFSTQPRSPRWHRRGHCPRHLAAPIVSNGLGVYACLREDRHWYQITPSMLRSLSRRTLRETFDSTPSRHRLGPSRA